MYKRFLHDNLLIEHMEQIEFEPFTKLFTHEYIALCQKGEADSCAAILAFATEAIVPRLYQIFKKALLGVGLTEKDLLFFNIHIECDDAHAATLEAMTVSYLSQPFSLERCQYAIRRALDLRDQFFSRLRQAMIDRHKRVAMLVIDYCHPCQ
ncbi:iron-containing redox enzyme family protein [Candidiatus Paracoxiella cheracis]|uniref:iron-containing redox enzyme family protein n=1 Tax=Candidiatus Paracoxiella cheracis TaxID=3405120 RepID=UPI003BF5731A